jgi:hypothetical protein
VLLHEKLNLKKLPQQVLKIAGVRPLKPHRTCVPVLKKEKKFI